MAFHRPGWLIQRAVGRNLGYYVSLSGTLNFMYSINLIYMHHIFITRVEPHKIPSRIVDFVIN